MGSAEHKREDVFQCFGEFAYPLLVRADRRFYLHGSRVKFVKSSSVKIHGDPVELFAREFK